MSALTTSVLAAVGGFIGVAVGDLVSEELRARFEKVPRAILRVAVLRVPAPLRGDLHDEWSAELAEILSGTEGLPVTRLWFGTRFASGLLRTSAQVGRTLGSAAISDPLPAQLAGMAFSALELETIRRAHAVAAHWHRNQRRRSGDPYVTHCVAVARILSEMGMDAATVCAGLLHDVPADTDCPPDQLRAEFGGEIEAIVRAFSSSTPSRPNRSQQF